MARYSEISQTEDPTLFPTASNIDGSIQQRMHKDLDLKDTHSITQEPAPKQVPNNLKADEPTLELIDKRRNFANVHISYSKDKQEQYIIDSATREVLTKIRANDYSSPLLPRINQVNLSKTFASLNIYDKEIIVWIRIHHAHADSTFSLLTDIMQKFNISESRSLFLLDAALI